MDILDYFPAGLTPREGQRKVLLEVQDAWKSNNVFVLLLPTAAGKTEVALTIARWSAAKGENASYVVPTNILVEQTLARYPDITVLHRQEAYTCAAYETNCGAVKQTDGGFCKGCVCARAKREAKEAAVRLMNTHVYSANKMWATTTIFDEAHLLPAMVHDRHVWKLRSSQFGALPPGLKWVTEVMEWLQELKKTYWNHKAIDASWAELNKVRDTGAVFYGVDKYRGKSDPYIVVRPLTPPDPNYVLWNNKISRKLVLMSATLSQQELVELGLTRHRSIFIECPSPIPPANRPVVYWPSLRMDKERLEFALPAFARRLEELLKHHPEKGLVHLPYAAAATLSTLMNNTRLMFHDNANKAEVLAAFKDSASAEGKVLVASGLYEGLDLPYDLARWQLIGKVPYMNLGDPFVSQKAEARPDWYMWEAVKKVVQAAGRIVRAEDDRGVTYIWDMAFGNLWRKHRNLFPSYFREVVREVTDPVVPGGGIRGIHTF
jgi:Rad3-related DNA helicase